MLGKYCLVFCSHHQHVPQAVRLHTSSSYLSALKTFYFSLYLGLPRRLKAAGYITKSCNNEIYLNRNAKTSHCQKDDKRYEQKLHMLSLSENVPYSLNKKKRWNLTEQIERNIQHEKENPPSHPDKKKYISGRCEVTLVERGGGWNDYLRPKNKMKSKTRLVHEIY